jgi:hypothetical protein
MLKHVAVMATVDPAPGRRKSRKSSASNRDKARRKRRPSAKKKSSAAGENSVGRLERTRRLLLAALRVWELKRRVRD